MLAFFQAFVNNSIAFYEGFDSALRHSRSHPWSHATPEERVAQERKDRGTERAGACPEKLSNAAADWLAREREVANGNMATVCPLPVSQRRDVTRIFRWNSGAS